MKKNPEIGEHVKKFREDHYPSQKAFADALGLGQSVVSAWERGENIPSSEAWVKIASVAPSPHNLWFLRQAGIDEQAILSAAEGLLKNRSALPVEGEITRIPRFRETLQGREPAGPLIPLPKEFIPNPASTVCFVVDKKATAVVDSPHAVFILDEADKNASNLLPFWGNIVFAEYDAEAGTNSRLRSGIYAGRLVCVNYWPHSPDDAYSIEAELHLITGLAPKRPLEVGWKPYPARRGSGDIGFGMPPVGQTPLLDAAREKLREQAASELRLSFGWRILGRVIGRLAMSEVSNVAPFTDIG